MVLSTTLSDMSELAAVVTLGEPVGGDNRGDLSGAREEADGGSHRGDILWSDGDGNRGGEFPLSRGRVWVEKPGREDGDPSCIADRGSQGIIEVVGIGGEVGDRKGVDGQLCLVGGEPEGEPGGLTHREGLVESGSNGIEKGGVGRRWSLDVGDDHRYGTTGVNFHCEPKRKLTVVGAEEGSDGVREGSGDVFFLGMRGGG